MGSTARGSSLLRHMAAPAVLLHGSAPARSRGPVAALSGPDLCDSPPPVQFELAQRPLDRLQLLLGDGGQPERRVYEPGGIGSVVVAE